MFYQKWFISAGYGNIAPKTPSGKVFCIFYGLFGVPLCFTWISELGKFFGGRAKHLGKHLTKKGVTLVRNLHKQPLYFKSEYHYNNSYDIYNCILLFFCYKVVNCLCVFLLKAENTVHLHSCLSVMGCVGAFSDSSICIHVSRRLDLYWGLIFFFCHFDNYWIWWSCSRWVSEMLKLLVMIDPLRKCL